ncbi:alpha/beta fold hydrolase [Nonomuraea sp. NPDC050404]|uniref:alpha/beta fold hydrolase n=1 Tax=Nonomuraea sp. NPDC050404 TaxID=3155783 RepID=UPI0033CFD534
MLGKFKTTAVTALCCTALGMGVAGCDSEAVENWDPFASSSSMFSGTKKITVDGKSVNVSCAGGPAVRPTIVLLHGGGDDLTKLAALQKTLSKNNRVCSYDRLGAGASDKPAGPQDFASTGKILTGVIDQVAEGGPVVLAGHSLGGIIAARYAPEHQDKVKGLVLMDATPSTMIADISTVIPKSAKGPGAQVRAQNLAIFQGQNPEQLVIKDGKVGSAGNIPVEVIMHGQQYLAAIPTYGKGLEKAWAAGQRKWLELSGNSKLSTATKSGHYIYTDTPDVAVKAIETVTSQAAGF